MSDLVVSRIAEVGGQPGSRTRRLVGPAIRIVWLMLARSRERRVLASLDARMLRDVGLTPYEAGKEARKWFWAE